jgi:hypothetical protein
VILIVKATLLYPGGSIFDKKSIGFDWTKNFISNLFGERAINGAENPARIWAVVGMVFHSVGFGVFFINMSKKIIVKPAATVLLLVGAASIVCNFLIVTRLHDSMVTVSSTLFLIGLFYITVFSLKTKLHFLKHCCIICLLLFYYTLFLFGCGNLSLLPIMQKVAFISSMVLVLALEYFTKSDDFLKIESGVQENHEENKIGQ